MESLNHCSSKRSLVEEDANISTFRRRNKIIILVFLFLIISLALIIASLIIELVRIHNTSHSHNRVVIPPIKAFCSVSNAPKTCLKALNPIINNRFIVDPDQIFTISLQTAANDIQNLITSSILSDSGSAELAFKNCSNSLRHGLVQLGDPLATMRVNPFVGSLSMEQRGEIMKRIIAAEEDIKSCVDDLAKVGQSAAGGVATAKLVEVEVYLNSAKEFLLSHAKVLFERSTIFIVDASPRGIIYDNLFAICMCGLQLLFMFGMFCALFRIR